MRMKVSRPDPRGHEEFVRNRLLLNAVALSILCGCYTPLARPLTGAEIMVPTRSQTILRDTRPQIGETHTASIGDQILVYWETLLYPERAVAAVESWPWPLGHPPASGWRMTHRYTGDDDDLFGPLIYTNPSWYGGQIGVVVDEFGRAAIETAFVQVGGPKEGRTWDAPLNAQIFSNPGDQWAIRFAGQREGQYYFEVVTEAEQPKVRILQDFFISPDSLVAGFTVRGVEIRATPLDKQVIQYQIVRIPEGWTNSGDAVGD